MKLSQYAKQQGISYRTALRWFRAGTIMGYQAPTGTIIVTEGETTMNTYSHVTAQLQRDAADQMDALFTRGLSTPLQKGPTPVPHKRPPIPPEPLSVGEQIHLSGCAAVPL
jgi:hypothetical protein